MIIRRGGQPCFLNSRFSKRLAALVLRRRLDDLIEHIAVLINRPPQPVFLARDRDHDLVEVPDVAAAWRLAPEAASVRRPELQRPAADRLIGDDDAALEQHLLDQPQAQRKPEVQPDRMGDDLRRKAMAFVADGLAHAGPSTPLASHIRVNVTTPQAVMLLVLHIWHDFTFGCAIAGQLVRNHDAR